MDRVRQSKAHTLRMSCQPPITSISAQSISQEHYFVEWLDYHTGGDILHYTSRGHGAPWERAFVPSFLGGVRMGGAVLLNLAVVAQLSSGSLLATASQVVTFTYDASGRLT